MDRLETMRLFVRVVESGSFSTAARALGVTQPTVSKQVAALEAHLGAQLLRRSSRSLSLTEAGRRYYDTVLRLLDDLDAAETEIGHGARAPSGQLRVTVSAGFGRLHVVPLLPEFLARHPAVTVELVVSDRYVDLVEEGIDIALRFGALADSSLVGRRIGASPRATLATTRFLARHGEPATPADLARFPCVAFTFQGQPRPWDFATGDGPLQVVPRGPVRTNDAEHIRAAVLADLGLAQAPTWLFAPELEAGTVRTVLPALVPPPVPIHALYPGGRRPGAKVRAFVDFMAEAFARCACFGAETAARPAEPAASA